MAAGPEILSLQPQVPVTPPLTHTHRHSSNIHDSTTLVMVETLMILDSHTHSTQHKAYAPRRPWMWHRHLSSWCPRWCCHGHWSSKIPMILEATGAVTVMALGNTTDKGRECRKCLYENGRDFFGGPVAATPNARGLVSIPG